MTTRKPIELGDTVKDPITGITGVVVCRSEYLYGCMRVSIQPKAGKDGKMPDWMSFDEPQLQVVKRGTIKPTPVQQLTGGPRPDPGPRR